MLPVTIYEASSQSLDVADADGTHIAAVTPKFASFVVTACNSHARLVEALRSFPSLPFIEDMTPDQMADKLREISAWIDAEARAALAAAGEHP